MVGLSLSSRTNYSEEALGIKATTQHLASSRRLDLAVQLSLRFPIVIDSGRKTSSINNDSFTLYSTMTRLHKTSYRIRSPVNVILAIIINVDMK